MITARTIETVDYYVTSFSAEPDLLGQWRAYCMAGRGFAIGYQSAPLTRMNNEVYLFRVTYDREEQEQAVRSIIEIYIPGLVEAAEVAKRDLIVAAGAALGVPLALLLLAFKHEAYAEEREYRLVRSGINPIPLDQVEFRSTANMIVPFIEFDLADHRNNSNGKAPLAEIVVGPSVDAARAENHYEC